VLIPLWGAVSLSMCIIGIKEGQNQRKKIARDPWLVTREKNAKITNYPDKEIRDSCFVVHISYGFRIRCGMTGNEIAAAFGLAITFY